MFSWSFRLEIIILYQEMFCCSCRAVEFQICTLLTEPETCPDDSFFLCC